MSYLENFHYQIVGADDKPKLVFLHGLMGSGKNWARIASQFSEQFQILTFDQRGHGRSFKPNSGYRPEDYAEDLHKITEELGWKRFHLVGHSMGGRNAIQFAALYPNRLQSLTVEDIGVFNDESKSGNTKKLLDLVPVPFSTRAEAREFFQNKFESLIPENPIAKTLANYFYMNMAEQPDGTTGWRFSKQAILDSVDSGRDRERDEEWASISCPILLLRGDRSTDLTQSDFEKMAQLNAQCKPVIIEDSGHWIHFDQPESFTSELSEFLKQQ